MRNDTVKQGCPLLFSGIVCYRVCHRRPIGPDSDCSLKDKRKKGSVREIRGYRDVYILF